jgi:hypothetical protein
MTIMATHFAIVLGAWRLRVRIDLDEPREDHACASGTLADDHAHARSEAHARTRPTVPSSPRWN